jgi:hypothetical protein
MHNAGLRLLAVLLLVVVSSISVYISRQAQEPEKRRPLFSEEKVIVKITDRVTKDVFYTHEISEVRAWNYIEGGAAVAEAFDCLILFPGSREYWIADLVPLAKRWRVPERFDAATFEERFGASRRKILANASK